MKQNVSPAVVVVIIALLVIVLGYFGYKATQPERSPYKMSPEMYEKQLKAHAGGNTGAPTTGYPGSPGNPNPGNPNMPASGGGSGGYTATGGSR